MSLLQQKYDVKHLNGFIPAMYYVHINTRRVSRLGGMKRPVPSRRNHINRPLDQWYDMPILPLEGC